MLVLGCGSMLAAVARGIATGRLFELGSNNLVVFAAGFAALLCGWGLRQERAARVFGHVVAASAARTPAFLSGLATRPLFHVTLALWCGITLGLAESAVRIYREPAVIWWHALWLGPLAYAALFGLLGLVATVGARRDSRGWITYRIALATWLALGFAGLIFLTLPRVHVVAAVVLASGLAFQMSRLLVDHAYTINVVMRRSGWVLAFTVAVIAPWMTGGPIVSARRSGTLSPPFPESTRNVLLIVMDTVRARNLSLLGYQRPTTPNLERWAEQGIVFQSALATAPWTLPSHGGMFTGRWSHELSSQWTSTMDGTYPTIAEVMSAHGYATAGFVGNLVYTTRQTGLARGFDHYEDFKIGVGEAILSTSLGRTLMTGDWIRNALGYHELANRKHAGDINRDFLAWLDQRGPRPFFAFLNYFDAHEPYMPPEPHAARFRSGAREPRGSYVHQPNQADHADWASLSASQIAHEQALYDAAIASLDQEIGRLLDSLRARDLLRNTAVIITSDHGENFGEHGVFMHGNSLYLSQLHVPLVILSPDRQARTSVAEVVSLRDIPNTVLDLARLSVASPFPGSSLARFWTPQRSPRPADEPMPLSLFPVPGGSGDATTPLARGHMRSLVADPYHYVLNGDGVEELFNFRSDPLEEHNLARAPMADGLRASFREMMASGTP